jgi:hypothetical protein
MLCTAIRVLTPLFDNSTFGAAAQSSAERAASVANQENVMAKFGLIGATVLVLTVGFVASASARDEHGAAVVRHKKHLHAVPPVAVAGEPNLPVENALRWGYSQGYSNYPSGFGGLYGDGRYPGNTVSNRNYPTWW